MSESPAAKIISCWYCTCLLARIVSYPLHHKTPLWSAYRQAKRTQLVQCRTEQATKLSVERQNLQ